ncbi:hypothetical protein L210DRAFT_2002974 [Boletus edulis BED1]|uniref:Uncharacterized protein n=1 Tax=Boletus edulis BED1 TaxID=1328754 RepID=A0AAD4C7L8_BOLED|nr:hypothetical protein L210DRAFT_2002974 [Boletus edulis BED1]
MLKQSRRLAGVPTFPSTVRHLVDRPLLVQLRSIRRVDGRGRSSHAKRARSNAGGCSESARRACPQHLRALPRRSVGRFRRTADGSRHQSVAFCIRGRDDQGAGSNSGRRRPLGGVRYRTPTLLRSRSNMRSALRSDNGSQTKSTSRRSAPASHRFHQRLLTSTYDGGGGDGSLLTPPLRRCDSHISIHHIEKPKKK